MQAKKKNKAPVVYKPLQAGGLLESASTVKIDVTRRIKDATSTDQTEQIAEVFTFDFKDGYVLDGEAGFVLQPYDNVFALATVPFIYITYALLLFARGAYPPAWIT